MPEPIATPDTGEWLAMLAEHYCPTCGTQLVDLIQQGCCTYTVPCGHKAFKGKALQFKREVWKEA